MGRTNRLGTIVGALLLSLSALSVSGPTPANAGALEPGDLVVADRSGEIHRVDPATGQTSVLISGGLLSEGYIGGLAMDSDGDLLVTTDIRGRILPFGRVVKIDTETGEQSIVAQSFQLEDASRLAIDSSGNPIVTSPENRQIVRVEIDAPFGTETILVRGGAAQGASRIRVDDCGDLITDGHETLVRTHAESGEQTIISESRNVRPRGLDIDADGSLLILHRLDGWMATMEIVRMDPFSGEWTTITQEPIVGEGSALAVGPRGAIFVATSGELIQTHSNRFEDIVRVDPETGEHVQIAAVDALIVDLIVVPDVIDDEEKLRRNKRCRMLRYKAWRASRP